MKKFLILLGLVLVVGLAALIVFFPSSPPHKPVSPAATAEPASPASTALPPAVASQIPDYCRQQTEQYRQSNCAAAGLDEEFCSPSFLSDLEAKCLDSAIIIDGRIYDGQS